ncbi:hypothetical protein [Oceanicoccus sagamiensis]|uniref:DUF4386 domain-containing protein n=1 Tax=Oceanicoccus sagamiensis TaxID=716816 RepID=A0A1X9NAX3_9GAMM|nr:hypothetical protein [Oceanicoccus sagamiensis]ARN73075.1 hypothetical protein BST96_02505 [Oceanicoccus sagamiensis]
MNTKATLDYNINRVGFWSAILTLVTFVITMLLPLDAPGGYAAEHADRVAWLSANSGAFIAGWVNQIVAMLALSGVWFALAWRAAPSHPLSAILAAMVVLMSVMAFIIPKFIAVWTIPLLADTITAGAVGAEMADSLLLLLNVSIPFSLYTSFDYLGFWLYSVFALLVAIPLYGQAITAKITSISLGLFGVIYQLMMVALFMGEIAPQDIEANFLGASLLLILVVIVMIPNFKSAMSSGS